MRRGHSSIGGWRNENSRHFNPRIRGSPQFRANRNFHIPELFRHPHAGSHTYRESSYGNRPSLLNTPPPEIHERNKFRTDYRQNNQYRPHHQNQRSLHVGRDHERCETKDRLGHSMITHNDKRYFNNDERCQVNILGDVDHRKTIDFPKLQDPLIHHSVSQWNSHEDIDDRNSHKSHRYHDNIDGNKIPMVEYSRHRPPSSDHYGGNPSSTLDNSNSFSRSVDDTVDIIRKRLQNRNDSNQSLEEPTSDNNDMNEHLTFDEHLISTSSNYENIQQNLPAKRRVQKHRHNIEANCGKMKNKIVHELFKMDKDKIHKLMDNPSSSSKFEYALSSLITESQNSLNRHLRSVAEKSLCSSEAFVHNDNNTIYEDTFMKQMQGILDPQDTILLEDIKPLVLAELSKVLQLDEYDQPFKFKEGQGSDLMESGLQSYEEYVNCCQDNYYEQIQSPQTIYDDNIENTDVDNNINEFTPVLEQSKPLFERRPVKNAEKILSPKSRRHSRSSADRHSRFSIDTKTKEYSVHNERRHCRRSLDNKLCEEKEQLQPFFDSKADPLSEEDDPFAELDRQYHVAVDPNFIDTYDISCPQQPPTNISATINELNDRVLPTVEATDLKNEINTQLLNIAKSPIKWEPTSTHKNLDRPKPSTFTSSTLQIKQETFNVSNVNEHLIDSNYGSNIEPRNEDDLTQKSETTPSKTLLSNSRKRSTDQKPSHRKEKRKKSDSIPPEKDTVANESTSKDKDFRYSQTIPNMFFSKSYSNKSKDNKKNDTLDKRKPTQNGRDKEEGQNKRQRSVSSSHSTVSPKDNSNNNNNKPESKSKLQSIDMFVEPPKKINVHQARRNTALPSHSAVNVSKPVHQTAFNKKLVKKHVAIQVSQKLQTKETQTFESKSSSTRFCQTDRIKTSSRCVQTDPVTFEKNGTKAKDAFERMKEIDLEIQVLLQEKFKLYNSLESNQPCPSTIQTLGMTVLNVTSSELKDNGETDIDALTEDAIVENFTNIPVEELEQIALESVAEHPHNTKFEKKCRRQKILAEERASSLSPTTRRNAKKAKHPNISLIEQIITDDRPLEDIISLDDLESIPIKNTRHKPHKLQNLSKKKVIKKSKSRTPTIDINDFNLRKCSVILCRNDISNYLKQVNENPVLEPDVPEMINEEISAQEPSVDEDTAANDLQFDMLDVSEDIVIGDNCEVKSGEDKFVVREDVTITEEVILDNSQSSDPQQSDLNQGENICKMYDYSTDESLRRDSITVSGHADAVLAIESIENNFIAACLDGNVYYFNSDGQLLSTLRGSNLAVTCLTIVKEKYGTTVYTGSLDSRIRYYDLETGLEKGPECNVLSPIQTMDRAWDTIFVGTRTGFVLQFECKNNMLIPVSTVKFSDQSILALRAMKEGPRKVLLVAARSEDVTIKDAQTGLLLRTLQGPKMTVYTLLYEDGKIYCGTSSHQIHVFDYTSGGHAGVHEGGKGAVCLRATGGLLFAGCYDGCVYVYREGEPRPLAQLRGPSLMLLSLAVVGSKIIAGYKDRSLYIWKIPLSILQEMIL